MINELYEVALSEDGTVYGPFETFVPGDARLLDNFVKFRVTVFGDFAEDDYRVRGFSGIVDDATTNSGGFGISPFGRFPFGDGGICLETSGIELDGLLGLSGSLEISNPNLDLSGALGLSGDLSVFVTVDEAGSLALSGDLTTVVTNPAAGVLFSYGPTVFFAGTQNFSIATFMSSIAGQTTDQTGWRSPIAFTITTLYVKLSGNVGATHTFTAKFVVNDVVQSAIIVTIPAGSRVGSATGVLNVAAHDKLGMQVNYTGPSISVESFTAGYFST